MSDIDIKYNKKLGHFVVEKKIKSRYISILLIINKREKKFKQYFRKYFGGSGERGLCSSSLVKQVNFNF